MSGILSTNLSGTGQVGLLGVGEQARISQNLSGDQMAGPLPDQPLFPFVDLGRGKCAVSLEAWMIHGVSENQDTPLKGWSKGKPQVNMVDHRTTPPI